MITKMEYERALRIIKKYQSQIHKEHEYVNKQNICAKLSELPKDYKIIELPISSRLRNAIINHFDWFHDIPRRDVMIQDMSLISLSDFRRQRGSGEGTAKDLNTLCGELGIRIQP